MRTAELQSRLRALGLDPGPSDGVYGPLTEEAIFDALDYWAPEVGKPVGIVPLEWVPVCSMQRVICHWTAGAWKANATDVAHYHILIEDDGRLIRGSYSIKDNVDCSDGRYAAHTKGANSGSIGVSLCCMAGAVETPFDAGRWPLTSTQWDTLSTVVAELCQTYSIPVTAETVLSHAEVERTLGIKQAGKWDYTRLAFDETIKGARSIGNRLREDVQTKLSGTMLSIPVETAVAPSPTVIA